MAAGPHLNKEGEYRGAGQVGVLQLCLYAVGCGYKGTVQSGPSDHISLPEAREPWKLGARQGALKNPKSHCHHA